MTYPKEIQQREDNYVRTQKYRGIIQGGIEIEYDRKNQNNCIGQQQHWNIALICQLLGQKHNIEYISQPKQ